MRTTLLAVLFMTFSAVPSITSASAFDNLDATTINYFASQGMLEGSLDESVHLASHITRAQFVQAVTEYVYPEWAISEKCLQGLDTDIWPGISYTLLFNDVSKNEPYALHLCAAMRGGMVWGYGDGNFKPNDTINLAEASKIISIAFNLGYDMPEYQTDDWYSNYLKTVRQYTALPANATSPAHIMRIGETRIMLQNISARVASHHGSRVNGKLDHAIMNTFNVQPISTSAAQEIAYSR